MSFLTCQVLSFSDHTLPWSTIKIDSACKLTLHMTVHRVQFIISLDGWPAVTLCIVEYV